MGAVPGVQLGHTGRKGGMTTPWEGYVQLPDDHPDVWEAVGPTDTPYGGKRFPRGAKYATKEDIARLVGDFARGAERALEAGFEWVEMHYAHGFLGASFLSPVANTRDDEYGGSLENRARFLVEAFDAVRAVWPERLPLTMRVGAVDYGMESHSVEDTIWLVRTMAEHGLDLVDISMGMNTDAGGAVPWTDPRLHGADGDAHPRRDRRAHRRELERGRARLRRRRDPRREGGPAHGRAADHRQPALAAVRRAGAGPQRAVRRAAQAVQPRPGAQPRRGELQRLRAGRTQGCPVIAVRRQGSERPTGARAGRGTRARHERRCQPKETASSEYPE